MVDPVFCLALPCHTSQMALYYTVRQRAPCNHWAYILVFPPPILNPKALSNQGVYRLTASRGGCVAHKNAPRNSVGVDYILRLSFNSLDSLSASASARANVTLESAPLGAMFLFPQSQPTQYKSLVLAVETLRSHTIHANHDHTRKKLSRR